MSRVRKQLLIFVALLALAGSQQIISSSAASATGGCDPTQTARWVYNPYAGASQLVNTQYCPIWTSAPVMDYSAPPSTVGWLWYTGYSNWFVCQFRAESYSAYGYSSIWWAVTVADNGAYGRVSAVYYSGAEDYWSGLRPCG